METWKGYCVRVDAREGYADKMQALTMVPDYQAIIAVKHRGRTGENPHYHLVIQTDVKEQAFRVRMKKVFDQGKGNAHMSIKYWDGSIDAISYLFHEDEDAHLVVRYKITDELLQQARIRNEEVQLKMEQSRERASWKLEDIVYEQFNSDRSKIAYEESVASAIILTSLRSGKYMPNDYMIKGMTRRILFRLLDKDIDQEQAFADSLARTIFWRPPMQQ